MLFPGETIIITFSMFITRFIAQQLNTNSASSIPGADEATVLGSKKQSKRTLIAPVAQLDGGGTLVIEDILILKLENGRDFFIPISANYKNSSFGNSLDSLVRLSKHLSPLMFSLTVMCIHEQVSSLRPIRKANDTIEEEEDESERDTEGTLSDDHSDATLLADHIHLSIPKELWRMVDDLYQVLAHRSSFLYFNLITGFL